MLQQFKLFAELKMNKLRNWIEPPEQKIEFYLDKTTKIKEGYQEERIKLNNAISELRYTESENNTQIRRLQAEAYNEADQTKRYAKLEIAYYQQLRTDVISAEITACSKRVRELGQVITEISGKIEMLKLQSDLHKIKRDLNQPGIDVVSTASFDPSSIDDFLDQIAISNAISEFKSDSLNIEDKDEWINNQLGERTVC
jgi:predicted RNase H-like nuclease (RuvC/YqgF family)